VVSVFCQLRQVYAHCTQMYKGKESGVGFLPITPILCSLYANVQGQREWCRFSASYAKFMFIVRKCTRAKRVVSVFSQLRQVYAHCTQMYKDKESGVGFLPITPGLCSLYANVQGQIEWCRFSASYAKFMLIVRKCTRAKRVVSVFCQLRQVYAHCTQMYKGKESGVGFLPITPGLCSLYANVQGQREWCRFSANYANFMLIVRKCTRAKRVVSVFCQLRQVLSKFVTCFAINYMGPNRRKNATSLNSRRTLFYLTVA